MDLSCFYLEFIMLVHLLPCTIFKGWVYYFCRDCVWLRFMMWNDYKCVMRLRWLGNTEIKFAIHDYFLDMNFSNFFFSEVHQRWLLFWLSAIFLDLLILEYMTKRRGFILFFIRCVSVNNWTFMMFSIRLIYLFIARGCPLLFQYLPNMQIAAMMVKMSFFLLQDA